MFSLSIFKAASRASTPLLTRSLLARPALPLARAGYASINIDPAHLETYHKDVLKDLGEETNSDPDVVVLVEEEEYDVLSPPPQEILKHHGTVVAAPQPDIEINPVVLPGEKWDETKATESEEDVFADKFPVKDTAKLQELTVEEELALEQKKRHGKKA